MFKDDTVTVVLQDNEPETEHPVEVAVYVVVVLGFTTILVPLPTIFPAPSVHVTVLVVRTGWYGIGFIVYELGPFGINSYPSFCDVI